MIDANVAWWLHRRTTIARQQRTHRGATHSAGHGAAGLISKVHPVNATALVSAQNWCGSCAAKQQSGRPRASALRCNITWVSVALVS